MPKHNYYKPRYTLVYKTRSKVWAYKNSLIRRFFSMRARRSRRWGLFMRCALKAKSMKWKTNRRFFRPFAYTQALWRKGIQNTTAYRRVTRYEGKYSVIFYKKQQVRFFYGKVKEKAFRKLFYSHKMAISTRTHSFFSVLESRFDVFFFRIRLLPTIFACHQYIHYNGLEVNGKIECSPHALIRIGDIISVPANSWSLFYTNVLCRIYQRRWGIYIYRKRIKTQLKKVYLIFSKNNNKIVRKKFHFYTGFKNKPIYSKKLLVRKSFKEKIKSQLVQSIFSRGRRYIYIKKAKLYSRFKSTNNKSKPIKHTHTGMFKLNSQFSFKKKTKIRSKASALFQENQVSIKELLFKLNLLLIQKVSAVDADAQWDEMPSYACTKTIFIYLKELKYILINYSIDIEQDFKNNNLIIIKDVSLKTVDAIKLKTRIHILKATMEKHQKRVSFIFFLISKITQFQKSYTLFRRRKYALPIVTKYKKKRYKTIKHVRKFLCWRIKNNCNKKRRQKYVSLKAVHFFVPKYIQIDCRTLCSIKVQSPNYSDIYYPFRVSLRILHSFYRSKGFLIQI